MPDQPKDFLATVTDDLKRLQNQKAKARGGVEARMLLALCMDAGEHYTSYSNKGLYAKSLATDEEKNKLHLVFNLISQRRHKLIGRLYAIGGTFKANPDKNDPKAIGQADIVDRLIKALDEKVQQPARSWELLDVLTLGGVAYEYVPWVEQATVEPIPQYDDTSGELLFIDTLQSEMSGELTTTPESQMQAQVDGGGRTKESFEVYEAAAPTGEVGSEILSPLQVCIDQSVRFVEDLAPDQSVYILRPKTQGWIAETYGDESLTDLEPDQHVSLITSQVHQNSSTANTQLTDLLAIAQGSSEPGDPPMNLFVERYQPASRRWPRGRQTCFVPGKKILYDGDNKYGEVPLVDWHFEPVTKSHWTKDYVSDLIAPQRFLNKRMSQLGEQSNATLYANLLLGPGIAAKSIPADHPGPIENAVGENGAVLVRRQEPPTFPVWFMESINLAVKFLNDLAGGSDLFEEHKFPGQLRGPMAVPMLQEIIDTEWGPLYEHIGQRMARVKQMRLNRVKQFYPPLRTLHYTDTNQRDEVFEFHKDEVLGSGTNFQITVERGSLLPELRSLREARIRERLQGPLAVLYTDPRTGQLDRSKIAADLQFGDDGREGQEAQDRGLAKKLIARLWTQQQIPPVMPYYDHRAWLDELESAMKTTEFLEASVPIQEAFNQRWTAHNKFLQDAAQAQAQAVQGANMQNAIAQAVQQAAAQAAAQTVTETQAQMHAQQMSAPQIPQMLAQAQAQQQAQPQAPQQVPGPDRPQ